MKRIACPRNVAPRAGTLVSAALLVGAYPPFDWTVLIWIALVPWLLVVRQSPGLIDVLVQALYLQVLVGLGWGHWLPSAVSEFLGIPTSFGVLALLLNAIFHHLHLVPFSALVYWIASSRQGPPTSVALVALAFSYCGLDWIIPGIFQHEIGSALHSSRALSQIVELGGVPALTFLVVLVNLTVFSCIEKARGPQGWAGFKDARMLGTIVGVGLVLGLAWGFGHLRYATIVRESDESDRTLRVGIVQGSISNETKRAWRRGDEEAAREALGVYVQSTRSLSNRAGDLDLVVWPETAYPGIYRRPENKEQADLNVSFDQFISTFGAPIVFGAYDREDRSDRRVLRNGIFFVEPRLDQLRTELSEATVYHKSTLFPIGETLPLLSREAREKWFPAAAAFSSGSGPEVFPISFGRHSRPIQLGPAICYEDLFPSHFAELARLGAEVFVNISNDSWFGDSGEPRLHLIYARFRSIETRLPQIRVTNSGYSALLLPSGDVRYESKYGDRLAAAYSVPISDPHRTLLTRLGPWFGQASLGASCLGFGLIFYRRRKSDPTDL